ncbi:hypothetical protein [Cellulomonas shaoxiangyii]|uniref:hypothetical protein n=1 Tax=Cellulomonas shaoxiangyii TaxID=2566013 RepID=UPI00140DBF2D|nr:hypothetical protein [Cellulomonas shaoxiangyii]
MLDTLPAARRGETAVPIQRTVAVLREHAAAAPPAEEHAGPGASLGVRAVDA